MAVHVPPNGPMCTQHSRVPPTFILRYCYHRWGGICQNLCNDHLFFHDKTPDSTLSFSDPTLVLPIGSTLQLYHCLDRYHAN